MTAEQTISQAQADMRSGYFSGVPGMLVSGVVWLTAGAVAVLASDKAAVLVLLVGGMVIHPLSVVFARLLLVGGRYLTFQTLYGLRAYWVLGGVLCCAGLAMALARIPVPVAALAGGVIEVLFASFLFTRARRGSA